MLLFFIPLISAQKMIPSIKCIIHNDEEIVLLDISKKAPRKNRCYCFECMNQVVLEKTIQIKKVIEQVNSYCNKITNEIKEEYGTQINKIDQILKTLNTIKKKTINSFDDLIKLCEKQLNEYTKNMQEEIESYQNITKDMTRPKLEQIGVMLSGNHQRESKNEQHREKSQNLGGEISMSLNKIITEEQETIVDIRQILMDQIILQSSFKQEKKCCALACNREHNMIVGGRGKDIIIWKYEIKLAETFVLQGHTGDVLAIVIFESGEMIASGGDSNDASLKLWKKHNTFWDCVSSIYEHAERINDLQLTQNQKHLVSASDDELIKIWRFKPPDYQLECIQTLNDHKHCVYYISISWDSLFMASSCWGNYFNIYKSDQTSNGLWKRWNQIDTKGKIKRIYFTKTNDLLVQQKNPSLIIVYQKNQKNLFLPVQEVKLNQSDSIHILFPIFQQDNKIYLKNDNFVYILRRLKTGNYFIQQILSGSYYSGCSDITGEGIIVWDTDNKLVEVYI